MASIEYQRAFLIYNPKAGFLRRNRPFVRKVLGALEAHGHKVTPRETQGPGDGTRLARSCVEEGADLVLAMGGDGTIHEVMNGMIGSQTPLGALPAGTANVLAMETGLGPATLVAADQLRGLEAARIGVGLIEEPDGTPRRHFLLMAGAGFDAYAVASVNTRVKGYLGKGAYAIAALRILMGRLEELTVDVDGVRRNCTFGLASRVRNYGGDLEIALGASLLSDHIEAVLFEGRTILPYIKYVLGIAAGVAGRMKGVTVIKTNTIALEPAGTRTVHIQADGEECGVLPARVRFVPDALTILLPPEFLAKERRRWTT